MSISFSMGIVELPPEGLRLIYTNPAGLIQMELTQEAFGKLFRELNYTDQFITQWENNYRATKVAGKTMHFEDHTYETDQYFATEASYLGVGESGHDRYCFIVKDITERKKTEENRIKETLAISQMSKMSSLGEMAAGITHEIYNPLCIIRGFADLLKKRLSAPDVNPTALILFAEEIKANCNRITSITEGLCYISGGGPMESTAKVHVRTIVEQTIKVCRERFAKSDISITLNGLDSEALIDCKQTQISQVILNLLNNAYDAVLESGNKFISVTIIEEETEVAIKVLDFGHGISERVKEKIFDPFFTTKPVGKGSGLGLSICKGIADNHNAKLFLSQNAPGRTEFTFAFKQASTS